MEQSIHTSSSTSSASAAAAAAAATTATGTNQLQRILDSFQQQMLRMDDLETKMEARTAATRRRVANLLTFMQEEQQPLEQPQAASASHNMSWPVRQSHLRMWVTHLHEPSKTTTVSASLSEHAESGGDRSWLSSSPETTIIPETFTLQIEGKLLIGHLDHASANEFDRKIRYTPPNDDLDRSRGEKEDEEAVPEWNLTQLFERVTVTFQTVYQPKIHPMARILPSSSSPAAGNTTKTKKSSRRSSSAAAPSPTTGQPLTQDPDQVDFRKCLLSKQQVITWTNNMASQEDAHAWAFHYTPPDPVSGAYEVHSVICHIQLVARRWYPQEERYVILSPVLAEHLFPHQTVPPPLPGGGEEERQEGESQQAASTTSNSKKRKSEDITEATTADGHPFPPVDPEILIPATPLLLSEILLAISVYIRDNELMDPEDRSTILVSNGNMLQQVLGGSGPDGGENIERLPFSQLQEALLRANAIAPEISPQKQYPRAPVKATYIMRKDTAWKDVSQQPDSSQVTSATTTTTAGTSVPALWQWDMECSVPLLFPFRARELLRRIKRRELEYSSSRTKARYLLLSQQQQQRRTKEEDESIRQQIEAVVANKSLAPVLQPVLWALAKGAATSGGGGGGGENVNHDHQEHATTEAQRACQLDQQISYLLLEQLPTHCRAAKEARELVAACLGLGEQ